MSSALLPTETDLAVEVQGVTKRYAYRDALGVHLRKFVGLARNAEIPGFLALRGVDLSIKAGERVGMVGRNGAGKTTLLKLIAGRSAITSGDIRVKGEVHALLELGAGFHPEFSGRVNINSALVHLGMSGDALEEAVAEVIDFVELGDHLDQPVRTYSRGMKTRLMFAAATALKPDVLLIDEVLGAGDPYFTAKAAHRVNELVTQGCTLLLVSHAPQQVLQFCERAVWMHEGQIIDDGEAVDVLNAYEAYIEHSSERIFSPTAGADATPGDSDGPGTLVKLSDGREVHTFPGKEGLKFSRIDFDIEQPSLEFDLEGEVDGEFGVRYLITFWRSDGKRVARVENSLDRFTLRKGETRSVQVDLGEMLLGPGDYTITFAAYDLDETGDTAAWRTVRYDIVSRGIRFTVEPSGDGPQAATILPATWAAA